MDIGLLDHTLTNSIISDNQIYELNHERSRVATRLYKPSYMCNLDLVPRLSLFRILRDQSLFKVLTLLYISCRHAVNNDPLYGHPHVRRLAKCVNLTLSVLAEDLRAGCASCSEAKITRHELTCGNKSIAG